MRKPSCHQKKFLLILGVHLHPVIEPPPPCLRHWWRRGWTNARPPVQSIASATPYSQTQNRTVNQNPRSVGRDTYKNCFQKGRWAKFCPAAETHGTNTQAENARQWNNLTNVITGEEAKPAPTAVYLKTRVNHCAVYGLLDSGCEHSVIKSSFVEHMELKPTG